MARKFYLIGHNPNTLSDAIGCLQDGANALEPDVCYDAGAQAFYVHEQLPFLPVSVSKWIYGCLSLTDYLSGLADYLAQNPTANLALIALDLKPPYTYDVNALFEAVRTTFSQRCPGIAILATVSSVEGMSFLARIQGQRANEAVGVDEYLTTQQVDAFFRPTGLHYTYANGTSVPLIATTKYSEDIRTAIVIRDEPGGGAFKLVYAWTVNSDRSRRAYLDLGVDGLITDNVPSLRHLLETEYADRYALATAQDSPFA